ncbi:MAG: cobalamin-dependent protein [Coriobacteriia bacterium]|jgi:trimethylamine corrinoid protein|nr:cobalamin-dependent protein [Coriobacteriia bacterium]
MSQEIFDRLRDAVVNGDVADGTAATTEAVAAGIGLTEAVDKGLAVGMGILSDRFDDGEAFVPQLLLAGKVFESAITILMEGMSEEDKAKASRGKVVIHTVQEDIHTVGKNLVATMLGANGFEVIDLGCNVPVDHVVEVAQKENADIIAGSALMTTTMPAMKEIVSLLEELGVRDQFKCMFGGAPVTEEWAMEFADGYAETAPGAVKLAMELLKDKKGA